MFKLFKTKAIVKAQALEIENLNRALVRIAQDRVDVLEMTNQLKERIDVLTLEVERVDTIEGAFEDIKHEWESYSDDLKNEFERDVERQLECSLSDVKDEYEGAIEIAIDDLKGDLQSDIEAVKDELEEQINSVDRQATRIEKLLARLVSKQLTVRKRLPGAAIRIQGI